MNRLASALTIIGASLAITLGVAIEVGAQCSMVSSACPTWGVAGAGRTGFCCVGCGGSAPISCSANGVANVTQQNTGCGELAPIMNGNCGNTNGQGCGSTTAVPGCTTQNCPKSGGS